MSSARKAVFLDRDGVINRRASEGLYINSLDEFEMLPHVGEAISRLNKNGFLVFVATNQRCIARGIVTSEAVRDIHDHLQRTVKAAGGEITRIYVCPHDYGDACACRKPKPGLLRQAARDYSLELSMSWMVGDKSSDIDAGTLAGCRTVFIGASGCAAANATAADLPEAVARILAAQ
jgi:D-glycero-D-manno-heptose 1,7-bisphosphate phosphatase